MDQHIKLMGELDKLLTESTSQTALKADLTKFKRMSEIINSRTNIAKDFIKVLRTKIMSLKHARSQLMLFELMEYLTAKCGGPMHTEFNNKDFLQVLNSVFNQANLGDEVRNKLLGLIQFWNVVFESKKDIYPNFSWYFNLIQGRGVPFPPFKQSPYMDAKFAGSGASQGGFGGANQGGFGGGNQGGFGGSNQGGFGGANQGGFSAPAPAFGGPSQSAPSSIANDPMFDTLEPKQKKLFQDLTVVLENVQLANSMMDQNEQETTEVMATIAKMQNKLQALPQRLQEANEGFLHAYCTAILEDISFTANRHQRFKQRQPAPRFNSQAEQIIEQARQMFSGQGQQQQQEAPAQDFGGNQQHGFDAPADFGGQQPHGDFGQPQQQGQGLNDFGGFGAPQNANDFGGFGAPAQQGFDQGFGGQQQGGFGDFGGQPQQPPQQHSDPFGGPSAFDQPKQPSNADPFGGF